MTTEAAETSKSTTERLFESYNSYTGRPTIMDPRARATIFKSLGRVLDGWLPEDRATRILDVACGEGALLCLLRHMGYRNLAGCDISPENVAICRQLGLAFVERFDALRLAERSELGKFGAIFALDMLEHLPKERAAGFVEQLRNLLLPGGYVVIQAPNMANLLASLHRYCDLSHEFGLTEKTAVALMRIAGFSADRIEVRAAWNATTPAGYLREAYLWLLHQLVWISEGAGRPRIPTMNLQIRASLP